MAHRDRSLETLFGGPLDESGITIDSLRALVESGTSESEVLDFKATPWFNKEQPDPVREEGRREFAKDVAAFANRNGGILLVGVTQSEAQLQESPFTLELLDPDREKRRLDAALLAYQAPPASCDYIWIENPDTDTWFLAVVVPKSPRAPHAVLNGNWIGYPVRRSSMTEWLNEHDVADAYRTRFARQQTNEARVDRILEDLGRVVERGAGLWHYLVVVPEMESPERLDSDLLEQMERWYRSNRTAGPLGASGVFTHDHATAGADRAIFSQYSVNGSQEPGAAYVELHTNGVAVAATTFIESAQQECDARPIGEVELANRVIVLSAMALKWATAQVGEFGMATLVCGFADGGMAGLRLSEDVALFAHEQGSYFRHKRLTRFVTGALEVRLTVDLGTCRTMQDMLVPAGMCLAGIVQRFGEPESELLSRRGALAPARFGGSAGDVAAWMSRHKVEQ